MVEIHSIREKTRGALDLLLKIPSWLVWAYGVMSLFNLVVAAIRLANGDEAEFAFLRAVIYVASLAFVIWRRGRCKAVALSSGE